MNKGKETTFRRQVCWLPATLTGKGLGRPRKEDGSSPGRAAAAAAGIKFPSIIRYLLP